MLLKARDSVSHFNIHAQLCTLSRVDATIASSKRCSQQLMLIFVCVLGNLNKTSQPVSYWTNGSVNVDSRDFRRLLLSVGDLTSCWDRQRTMVKLQPPSVRERDWSRKKLQSKSVGSQILSMVCAFLCTTSLCVPGQGCTVSLLRDHAYPRRRRQILWLARDHHKVTRLAPGVHKVHAVSLF